MTNDELKELNSLRQYKQETDAYVQRLKDNNEHLLLSIRSLRKGTDELMAALAERDDRIAYLEKCAGLAIHPDYMLVKIR